MRKTCRSLLATALLAAFCLPAVAALTDEIQVYTDEINEPGEFGLELHTITYPSGRRTQDYPGEVVTHRSLFLTPEFSWGLSKTFEAGLYLPIARDGGTDNLYMAGAKLRLKWLPVKADEVEGGWFAGANLEVGRVAHRFEAVRSNAELRIMLGWRNQDWLFGMNPVIGKELSDNPSSKLGYGLGVKGTRRVADGIALGLEYYSDRGQIGRTLPWSEQDNKLFLVMDYDHKPWIFNLGIGHGLTDSAEKTTLKAIFELPF